MIQAIPNAIGALCLNEVGQAQLAGRPSIIPAIFSIFTSDRHLKVLLDKEHAVLIGTAVDELIRHHPLLKASVFESIKATLSKIEDLGNAFVPPEDVKQWYKLSVVPSSEPSTDTDVSMEDIQSNVAVASSSPAPADHEDADAEETAVKSHDNNLVSFIDVLGRVNNSIACCNSY